MKKKLVGITLIGSAMIVIFSPLIVAMGWAGIAVIAGSILLTGMIVYGVFLITD